MSFQDGDSDLPFTGERVVLGKTPSLIVLEHLVRYRFAAQFVDGGRELDVACGTGYGSSILAEKARTVIGIDHSLETIRCARKNYTRPNLHYSIADCRSLPFHKSSFDLVVMFEAIEHIAEQEQSLSEIRRVLAPDGILILSTPNATGPTKIIEDVNPFHCKELTESELLGLLQPCFAHVRLLDQHELSASSIQLPAVSTSDPVQMAEDFLVPSAAKYFIAVCGAQEAQVRRGRTLGVGGIEHQVGYLKALRVSHEQIQYLAQQLKENERVYTKALAAHRREIEALLRQREEIG
jgi:SAM-dependent methyltransferase